MPPSDQNLEMNLREQLLAQPEYRSSESTSPREGSSSHPYNMSNDSGADDLDARKGKRELSTSKRAAQNRAAQRAFRQRKEGYIKKLEEQVKDFETMEQSFRSLQNENYQLREYILNLQSRLLENQSDIPPPPFQLRPRTDEKSSTYGLGASHGESSTQDK